MSPRPPSRRRRRSRACLSEFEVRREVGHFDDLHRRAGRDPRCRRRDTPPQAVALCGSRGPRANLVDDLDRAWLGTRARNAATDAQCRAHDPRCMRRRLLLLLGHDLRGHEVERLRRRFTLGTARSRRGFVPHRGHGRVSAAPPLPPDLRRCRVTNRGRGEEADGGDDSRSSRAPETFRGSRKPGCRRSIMLATTTHDHGDERGDRERPVRDDASNRTPCASRRACGPAASASSLHGRAAGVSRSSVPVSADCPAFGRDSSRLRFGKRTRQRYVSSLRHAHDGPDGSRPSYGRRSTARRRSISAGHHPVAAAGS